MDECIFSVDAGGTLLKYVLLTPDCEPIPGTEGETDAHSTESEQAIRGAYLDMTRCAMDTAQALNMSIGRVSISTPGPYNYENGYSMMEHKFKAIRGVSIIPWFKTLLPGASISFISDANAFLLGEAYFGAGRDTLSPAGVTLGTGFGFTYMHNRRLMVGESLIPAGALWNKPFRDGIVEDYVSRRAIRQSYQRLKGCPEFPDVKEIADLARMGDGEALETFHLTGLFLGEILAPSVKSYGIEKIVLGGQISRAHDLFLPDAQRALDCPIVFAEHPNDAALRGAAKYGLLGTHETMTVVCGL